MSSNVIGNWNLVTLGEFTFAKPVSVDLAPANAPAASSSYSVRCQIIYRDNLIVRPMSNSELKYVRNVGKLLNLWLSDFITAEYGGAEYGDLRKAYLDGEVAEDVNARFPEYVAGRISEMDMDCRLSIDVETVEIEAEGAFYGDLVKFIGGGTNENTP